MFRMSDFRIHVAVLILALLHFLVNLQSVFPLPFQLNVADEPIHSNLGRMLLNSLSENRTPYLVPQALNPLVALFYAFIYVPLHQYTHWMLASLWIGHALIFSLLWLGTYLVARQVRQFCHPLIIVGFLFITPVVPMLLERSTDGLYAAIILFALWQTSCYYHSRRIHHVFTAGALLGLAALTRNDGLALFPAFLLASGLVSIQGTRRWGRVRRLAVPLLAATIPYAALVGGYIAVVGFTTGFWGTGGQGLSYMAFEQSEGMAYSSDSAGYLSGITEARARYGTSEENRGSIVNAVLRNPGAYLLRVAAVILRAPLIAASAYGGLWSLIVLPFSFAGAIWLARNGERRLLAVYLLWMAPLSIYLLFYYREPYFLFPFPVVLLLAGIGLTWALSCLRGLSYPFNPPRIQRLAAPLLICVLLIAQIPKIADGPLQIPRIGQTGEEQTIEYLVEHYPRETRVASFVGFVPWAAKMHFEFSFVEWMGITSGDELREWVKRNDIELVYVDRLLRFYAPQVYELFDAGVGSQFREVSTIEDQSPERVRTYKEVVEAGVVALDNLQWWSHRLLEVLR